MRRRLDRRFTRPLALERLEDRRLRTVLAVTTSADAGDGSLRAAIETANATPESDSIVFRLPHSGGTIALQSPLPAVTSPVQIDGRTQPGYSGVPLVELDGAALTAPADGLQLRGGQSLVAGLRVVNFPGDAIEISRQGDNRLFANQLGQVGRGNLGHGVQIVDASNNQVGGAGGRGNQIVGNGGSGVIAPEGLGTIVLHNQMETTPGADDIRWTRNLHQLQNTGLQIGPADNPEVNINNVQSGPRDWLYGSTEENGYLFIYDPATRESVQWNAGRQEIVREHHGAEGDITNFVVWEEEGQLILVASHGHPAEIYRYEIPLPPVGLPDVSNLTGQLVYQNWNWQRVMSVARGRDADSSPLLLAGGYFDATLLQSRDGGRTWSEISYFDGDSDLDSARHADQRTRAASLSEIYYFEEIDTWFLNLYHAFLLDADVPWPGGSRHFVNGLLMSRDGGASWQLAEIEPQATLPAELQAKIDADKPLARVHPRLYGMVGESPRSLTQLDDGRLVLSTIADGIAEPGFGGRILVSEDGGATWRQTFHFQQYTDLDVIALDGETLLVGAATKESNPPGGIATGDVWISADGGRTFSHQRRVMQTDKPSPFRSNLFVAGVVSMLDATDFVALGTVNEAEHGEVFLLSPEHNHPDLTVHEGQLTYRGSDRADALHVDLGSAPWVTINGRRWSLDPDQVREAQFVGRSEDSLRLRGSAGADRLQFESELLQITNDRFSVEASGFSAVTVEGGGGSDSALLTGGPENELLRASLGAVELAGLAYRVRVTDFTEVKVRGGEGFDRAWFYGSPLNDQFIGRANEQLMIGSGIRNISQQFEQVQAIAGEGTDDRAYLYGSGKDVQLFANPAYAILQGSQFNNRADGFDRVFAYGDNDARATLFGSSGDDLMFGTADYSVLQGDAFNLFVHGFGTANLVGGGGEDEATVSGQAGVRFRGQPGFSSVEHASAVQHIRQFTRVRALATANDSSALALLTGSAADDRLEADSGLARLTGAGFQLRAERFPRIVVTALGGDDRALLRDGPGDDKLFAGERQVVFQGPGFNTTVRDFARVDSFSRQGADQAFLTGSSSGDHFYGAPDRASLLGPGYNNFAAGFTRVYALAGEGLDRATLGGSAANDRLESRPTHTVLAGDGYYQYATGFEQTVALGGGGEDLAVVDADSAPLRVSATPEHVRMASVHDRIIRDFAAVDINLPHGANRIDLYVDVRTDRFQGRRDRATLRRPETALSLRGQDQLTLHTHPGAAPPVLPQGDVDYAIEVVDDWR